MWKRLMLLMIVLLAACSTNTDSQDQADAPTPSAPSAPNIQKCEDRTPAPPAGATKDDVGKEEPDVSAPKGAPPCKLVVQDLFVGTGTKAEEDSTLTVQYVGVSWSTGEQFESSWGGAEPPSFSLSGVIPGWQQGIPGMKEGGRRQLIIPPDLAYGAQGRPGIAPNETLVFVIDLLKVN